MRYVLGYTCIRCGAEHGIDGLAYVCPRCGGNVQISYDYAAMGRALRRPTTAEHSIWRYRDLLPLDRDFRRPAVSVGWTPLYPAPVLGRRLGLSSLYVKDDGRNPSASFKDRAGAVVLARAAALGQEIVTAASTGNAAASLACLAAGSGIRTVIFVPASAPAAKLAQLLVFGARVITVDGTYDDAFDLSLRATELFGWYNRNTGHNPFTREGKKTAAYEICEQLGWEVPDRVFVPVGDGNILSGLWKGFVDLRSIGWIDRLPALVACQAAGSAAVTRAFDSDGVLRPASGETLADSISVRMPRDGEAAVRALRESGGFAVAVPDEAILRAIVDLARDTGVFAEPAAAVTLACLAAGVEAGRVPDGERIVLLITGSGLKDVGAAMKAVEAPLEIRPTVEELERVVRAGLV